MTIGAAVEKYCCFEAGDDFVPALLAGLGVERDQIIVRRLHVQPVAVHPQAAVADVRAAPGFPEVMPQLGAVARVDRPGIIRRRNIQNAVDLKNGALMLVPPPAANRRCLRRRRWSSFRRVRRPAPAVTRLTHASVRFFTFDWLSCVSEL